MGVIRVVRGVRGRRGMGAVTFWQWDGSVAGKVGGWGIRGVGGLVEWDESGDLQCVMVF